MTWALFLLAIAVGLYDLYVQTVRGDDGVTVSQYIAAISMRHPIVPFLFGLLAGHLFWRKG